MKEWLTAVLARVENGTLLPTEYYSVLDCDAAVDARNRVGEFDSAWVSAFNKLEGLWKSAEVESELRTLVEDIRHHGFLAVSGATGQHEIASYVSDDLDLIARGRLVGLNDPFLDRLWQDYERGEFPSPPL